MSPSAVWDVGGSGETETGEALARVGVGKGEKSKEEHTIGTSEREVNRGCLKRTQTKSEGESGTICLALNEARRGVFMCK